MIVEFLTYWIHLSAIWFSHFISQVQWLFLSLFISSLENKGKIKLELKISETRSAHHFFIKLTLRHIKEMNIYHLHPTDFLLTSGILSSLKDKWKTIWVIVKIKYKIWSIIHVYDSNNNNEKVDIYLFNKNSHLFWPSLLHLLSSSPPLAKRQIEDRGSCSWKVEKLINYLLITTWCVKLRNKVILTLSIWGLKLHTALLSPL